MIVTEAGMHPNIPSLVYVAARAVPLLRLGIIEHWVPNANVGPTLFNGMLVRIDFPRNYRGLLQG